MRHAFASASSHNIAATWDIRRFRICSRVGLNPVERTTHRHGVEPTLTADQRRDVRNRFRDANIEIWGCGTVCEFHSTDNAVVRRNIETCQRFCQLVSDIGGRGVKVRPNDLPNGVPTERTLEQIGRALAECGRTANDTNTEIWVEVHGRGTAHPPHIATMMRTADHARVGVTWNSNQTDIVNNSVAEYFRLLRPWIKSCTSTASLAIHIASYFACCVRRITIAARWRRFRHAGRGDGRAFDAILQGAVDGVVARLESDFV